MPALPGLETLSNLRISKIIKAIQDERTRPPARMIFSSRLPEVNATNGELMARFIGRILIADLVADDSRAGVYSSGKLTFESTQIPKIKQGRHFEESQFRQLSQLVATNTAGDDELFDFLKPTVGNILDGIEHRKEAMAAGMFSNSLSYDRLGYKASGVSWGMPTDLNITPSTPWTTAASATPIDDILNTMLVARTRYGIEYNRVTMSTAVFRLMIATTEFQNKAKAFVPVGLSLGTNLSTLAMPQMQRYAENLMGQLSDGNPAVNIVLSDERYWTQSDAGVLSSARFHPIDEVYLDDSRNDGNAAVHDMAKGEVVESLFFGLNPASVGTNLRRGPVGYMTFPADLNPPQLTLWGVDVAFPRKHLLQASAKIDVGTVTDPIAVTDF
jgi:hypothetical protein